MTSIDRRQLLLAGAGSLAMGLAGCSGTAVRKADGQASASPAGASASLGAATIGLTYIPNIQFAPFYLADEQHLFADRGVAATLRHHGASEALFTALAAGTEQFAIAGGDEVLQANSQGMDLVTVAGYYQRYPVVVIVPEGSTITRLADLKGRRIGVPGQYGESWFGLQLALHNAGLTAADVKVVTIGYTQQAALATHKVDAIVGFSNNDVVQFQSNGVAVRSLSLGEDVPLVSTSVVTTRALLTRSPELVRAVCQATRSAVQAVVADPQAALQASTGHVPGLSAAAAQKGAMATLRATLPLWKGDQQVPRLTLDEARFVAMEKFMRSAGLLTRQVDATRAVDAGVLR